MVRDVTPALENLPRYGYPLPRFDPLIANLADMRTKIESLAASAPRQPLRAVKLLSPVANPGKIIAAPVNYLKHLEEARADTGIHHQNTVDDIYRVGLFLKATSSLVGPSEGVGLQHLERRNDHEVELALVIGKAGRNIPRSRALEHVAGYCIGLDMTVRGPEERSLRKSIDGYTVLGPWFVTADAVPNPAELDISITVNGEPRQSANTRDLVMGIPELIEFAASYYTLHPGDVLLTGTPEGVGPVKPGDLMVAEIEGIGRMEVAVRSVN